MDWWIDTQCWPGPADESDRWWTLGSTGTITTYTEITGKRFPKATVGEFYYSPGDTAKKTPLGIITEVEVESPAIRFGLAQYTHRYTVMVQSNPHSSIGYHR